MEAIVIFIIEVLASYLYVTHSCNVSGGFPYAMEFLVCAFAALVSMVLSMLCLLFKKCVVIAKLIKTIVLLSIWIPFRIWWINFDELVNISWSWDNLYWYGNITIPEMFVLIYYVYQIKKGKRLKRY